LHEGNARTEPQCLAQIVSYEDSALVESPGELAEFPLQAGAPQGIERAKRLIKQQ
jgi:hypothetical protein